ncbi:GspE/PulE family protein [Salibacter halophilus]|uniref:Type II/IV secretion system protein n=1 Tax=Salibacter halophilus TaxID=1803916 RepID=A0A6N6M1F0_9FLAO|nr:GspE/PulE family protein [Salibacter halophilus]KAB1061962.1 type II/IV secretion system protein [Salibacter halophilus]
MIESEFEIKTSLLQLISSDQAHQYEIVPNSSEGEVLSLLTFENSKAIQNKDELELVLGKSIDFEIIDKETFNHLLHSNYRKRRDQAKVLKGNSADFLDELLSLSTELDSSDIHIEPYDKRCRVRYRIDGHLVEKFTISKVNYPPLLNKLKIRSNLDISEKRLPQDGRLRWKNHGKEFEFRVSVLPTLHGEKVVLRLLQNDADHVELLRLGMNDDQYRTYSEILKRPNGIILISGPTGSGKTTTLYATLKELNKIDRNICTVEDPIEYTLEGINQVQVKADIGLTFAKALRSFLRQDPDVIMLGEIRDGETAQMAIRAALTGHLVLSTIHTNSSIDTINRLIDMGVPTFLLSSTLNLSAAQRLLRKLCPHCKQKQDDLSQVKPPEGYSVKNDHEIYKPVGCQECHYTGYSGRLAIYELVAISSAISTEIRKGSDPDKIRESADHFKSLSEQAWYHYTHGTTSLEEVYPLLIQD